MQRNLFASVAILLTLAVDKTSAQVVQLPTFNFFGISTTVSVPDRGSASLGGVSSSSMGRVERGLPFGGRGFDNRAIASRSQTSGVSVSAYIHDFESMDEALLGQASTIATLPRSTRPEALSGHGTGLATAARPMAARLSSDTAGKLSVAEIRRQQGTAQPTADIAARKDFERGRELLEQGKTGLARVYLQRALKHADLPLRGEIAALKLTTEHSAPLADAAARTPHRR